MFHRFAAADMSTHASVRPCGMSRRGHRYRHAGRPRGSRHRSATGRRLHLGQGSSGGCGRSSGSSAFMNASRLDLLDYGRDTWNIPLPGAWADRCSRRACAGGGRPYGPGRSPPFPGPRLSVRRGGRSGHRSGARNLPGSGDRWRVRTGTRPARPPAPPGCACRARRPRS